MSQQPIDTNCMTITRFVLGEQRKFPTAHGDLSQLLTSIQSAVKVIHQFIWKSHFYVVFCSFKMEFFNEIFLMA